MSLEKKINYTASNTYTTLNAINEKTKNVWLVFHGMGYLSKYFTKYFTNLDSEENYIIAPQAPSKYYLGTEFKHVGACWLTRENTDEEIKNVLTYVDAVFEAEAIADTINFIVVGYSQGVSIALRWLSSRKIQCSHLILHSGGIPIELVHEDFLYQKKTTKVTYLCGDTDEYISDEVRKEQFSKGKVLFGDRFMTNIFKGGHVFYNDILIKIVG